MKKIINSILILSCAAGLAFAAASEASCFSEVSSALNSGFYPGVVEKSVVFEKQYPDSAYSVNVKLMKGEALINMFRYDEAVEELSSIESKLAEKSIEYSKCTYLCGLANYYLSLQPNKNPDVNRKYENQALKEFYKSCNSAKLIGDTTYYDFSLLFAGRIYFTQGQYEKVEQPFEYVVENGKIFSKNDFEEVIQKLIISYNKNQNYKKSIFLYETLNQTISESEFDFKLADEVYFTASLYAAEAYEENGDFVKAYDLYSQIVECGINNLAVIAMKKAYLLATEEKLADPAEIFSKSAEKFSETPELVCDFWTRLGIDEFNKGSFENSEEYFQQAKKINQTFLISLYEAKLELKKNNPAEAEKILASVKFADEDKNYSDSYYSTVIQTKALLEKWNEIPEVYSKISVSNDSCDYLCLSSYYNQNKFSECINFMEKLKETKNEKELSSVYVKILEMYASALSHNGEINKAIKQYEELDKKKVLSDSASIEYAKNLYKVKNYSLAYKYSAKSQDSQKDYICGLCANNLQNWEKSLSHFISYIKNQNGKKDFNKLAYYYKGYAEYRLADWKNAYSSFVRYGTEEKSNKKYLRKAYEYGARSALQVSDYKNAAIQAKNVINVSDNLAEKQEAILFCVEIYSNIEKYDEAIKILQPYSSENSEFGQNCLYQTAKIYEKQNRIEEADQTYTKIFTQFAGTQLAEDAMYAAGELYYSKQNYPVAEKKFNKYIYQFAKGKFLDAALFFCGDCNQKLGNYDKSILLNRTLISEFEKSIYLYGAYKNLLISYYTTEDYQNGLLIARTIVEKYPVQAAADEIGQKIIELERIIGGTDKRISEKISEYEKAGKNTTVKGRNTGTELVRFYAADASLQDEAYKLAKEVFAKQTDDAEAYNAAQNAEFIADYERRHFNDQEAGQMYLKAAGLYRKTTESKDNEIASVLYGAVEAFKAAGLFGDAESTADLLIKLYPESTYAANVKALLR